MKENNTYNEELGGKNLPDSLRVNPFLVPTNFFEEQEAQIFSQLRFCKLIKSSPEDSSAQDAHLDSVPNGYFNTLADNIFAKIAEQDLKDKVATDGFAVPDQYFDALDQDVQTRIAEENLKSIVPTLEFEVPEQYFSTAEDQIFSQLAESNLRDQIGKDTGFTVPTHYFEEANAAIQAQVITEKWSAEIGKNDFTVPTGYFDKLSENVLAKTVQPTKEETTIISLPRRTNWKKYSAAAAIALVVGIGSYWGVQNNTSTSNSLVKTEVNLDNVSDEEIISYLAQVSEGEDLIHLAEYKSDSNDDNVQLDPEIENKEIEEYLNYML